ncbi:MAG: tRNA (adenosine(37)-N6)-threonylcarbamoyltransferase complex dimerization subunit type 1 TsaB [Bacilli bacterium]
MYSLYLDSSNVELIVGLVKDDVKIDEISYEAWQRQSEYMILEIDKILKRNNVSPKEIEEVVTTMGPGSYTGVRISLTIAKIYAYSRNIPLYLLSSLEVEKKDNELSLCLMNARSGRSYVGIYHQDKTILADCILTNDEVKKYIDEGKYAICGDTGYLDIKSTTGDIINNMISIKLRSAPCENVLAAKPVYLKD